MSNVDVVEQEPIINDIIENETSEVNEIPTQDDVQDFVDNNPLAEIEKEALDVGWRPKEEFQGNPKDWQPAHKFLLNSVQIFKAEKKKHKQATKAMQRLLEVQGKNHQFQKEMLQKQLDTATKEKENALNSYDTDTVRLKDREIKEAETALRELNDPKEDIKAEMVAVVGDFEKSNPQIFNNAKSKHEFQYYISLVENDMRQNGALFVTPDEIEEALDNAKKLYLKENPLKDAKPVAAGIPSKTAPAKGSTVFDRLDVNTQKDIKFIVQSLNPKMEQGSTEFKKACAEYAKKVGV